MREISEEQTIQIVGIICSIAFGVWMESWSAGICMFTGIALLETVFKR